MAKVNPNPLPGFCACGKELHYVKPESEKYGKETVKKYGEFVQVHSPITRKFYWVQRHYIFLHGFKGSDFHLLGFKEVKENT